MALKRRDFVRAAGAGLVAASVPPALFGLSGRAHAQATRITGVYSSPTLTYAGLFIANELGLWAQHGLEVSSKAVRGGALATVALTNREANFMCVASSDPIIAWEKGIKTLSVACFNGAATLALAANNKWLEEKGISPDAPVAERVRALKGTRIGSATVGGGPAQYVKYLVAQYGLDPEKDIKMLAVGQGPSRVAALRERQVDLTIGASPEDVVIQTQGFGKLFINLATDIPIFTDMPFTVLSVRQDYAEQNPDVVRKIVQTIGHANNMIHDDFPRALAALQKTFTSISPQAIETSMKRDIKAYPRDAKMTRSMWANGIKIVDALKETKTVPSADEGVIWTNKFVA